MSSTSSTSSTSFCRLGLAAAALLCCAPPLLPAASSSSAAACTAVSSVRTSTEMNSVSSGGRCVCPGFASGSRCPPKGQTCGVAPGTLPNYYKQIRSDPTWRSIAECRNASLSPPCYAWCASLCEADTACMTFAFHDKGGPQCELYNVTNATRGGGWQEFAVGCSSKGALADAASCCGGAPGPAPSPSPTPPPPPGPAPAINCNPNANPPETCPNGKPCPKCGKVFCPCPPK